MGITFLKGFLVKGSRTLELEPDQVINHVCVRARFHTNENDRAERGELMMQEGGIGQCDLRVCPWVGEKG